MKTKLTLLFVVILLSVNQLVAQQDFLAVARKNEAAIQNLQRQVNELSEKLDKKEKQLSDSRKANYRLLLDKINGLSTRIENLEQKLSITETSTQRANDETANTMKSEVEKMRKSNDSATSSLQDQIEQMRQQMKEELEEATSDIREFLENNSLPVGSILPYNGSLLRLPDSWVLCDGKVVNDSESSYHGSKVPYLKGYFIRGKKDSEDKGDKGGDDYVSSHSHPISNHNHEVGSHKHEFTTNSNRGGFRSNTIKYSLITGTKLLIGNKISRDTYTHRVSYFENDTDQDGYHKHWGTTGNALDGHTDYASSGSTDLTNRHSNIPKYKAYNYIIKIK